MAASSNPRAAPWRSALSALAAGLVLFGPGCSQPVERSRSHGGPVTDHVSFVDHLRGAGYEVEVVGEVEQPFLEAEEGIRLRISGGDLEEPAELQSYHYTDPATAEADADRIGPEGAPRTAQVDWTGPPHFFREERVLVLYVGNDPAVLSLLIELLGPQFAGR